MTEEERRCVPNDKLEHRRAGLLVGVTMVEVWIRLEDHTIADDEGCGPVEASIITRTGMR
ncbi:MAG: hypothetical protein OXC54_03095 [Rhodospirillaceae bacterium]|nr:hypothetical protein [Rhodospirillaceae bacterium]